MSDDHDTIAFDEAEANMLLEAVTALVRARKWTPLMEDDWQELVAYRALMQRLSGFLDGGA